MTDLHNEENGSNTTHVCSFPVDVLIKLATRNGRSLFTTNPIMLAGVGKYYELPAKYGKQMHICRDVVVSCSTTTTLATTLRRLCLVVIYF